MFPPGRGDRKRRFNTLYQGDHSKSAPLRHSVGSRIAMIAMTLWLCRGRLGQARLWNQEVCWLRASILQLRCVSVGLLLSSVHTASTI